jgi:phenylalanyl-tRNA synthetase beta chain
VKFDLGWIAEYVDLADLGDVAALAEQLTAAGFAVERWEERLPGVGARGYVLEVDTTSNRPDAMCHFGLARELAVILGRPLRAVAAPPYAAEATDGAAGRVRLEDPDGCPRYVARIVRGVAVGPSPEWLAARLEAIGQRPVNNVVDATNYVLWELGQPLHAFDLATLAGGEIRVRLARAGERLTTLDGKERALDPELLVIADAERAVALAGVLGGLATEVTAATRDVLLESAHFDRRRVRAAARRFALDTDAAHRFERGADFERCDEASRRCAALLAELAGGTVEEPALDAVARRPERLAWSLDGAALERFAGCEIDDAEIEAILGGLGFAPEGAGRRRWRGTVPSWRAVDFEPRRTGEAAGREAYAQDVYEEVLRHVGYQRIPATLPALGGIDAGRSREHERDARVRDRLAALGWAETIHYAFQPRAWDGRYPALAGAGEPLALAHPLSERFAVLRRSLVPNLVSAAGANAHRLVRGVRLFEVGHLFPGGAEPELGAVAWVAGGEAGGKWDALPEVDLFAVKGVGEAVCDALGAAAPAAAPAELPGVVPGTGAVWRDARGVEVGWFGTLAEVDCPFPLHAAELLLDRLPFARGRRPVAPPPRLPGISADLTLTHPLALEWAELAAAVEAARVEYLVAFRLKERYRGPGVPAGAVATTITLDYHGGDHTLTQEVVNERHAALLAALEARFGVVRSGRPGADAERSEEER